jgi:hypothetical protein
LKGKPPAAGPPFPVRFARASGAAAGGRRRS